MSDASSGVDAYAIVRADLIRRIDELETAVRVLDQVHGSTPSTPPAAARDAARVVDAPGDFLGLSIAEAAKKFLAMRRRSMNSTEIADGLSASGYPMTAADPGNVVGSILSRRFDNVGDVVRVSRGQWGLPEWYPSRSFRKKELSGRREAVELTPAEVAAAVEDL